MVKNELEKLGNLQRSITRIHLNYIIQDFLSIYQLYTNPLHYTYLARNNVLKLGFLSLPLSFLFHPFVTPFTTHKQLSNTVADTCEPSLHLFPLFGVFSLSFLYSVLKIHCFCPTNSNTLVICIVYSYTV